MKRKYRKPEQIAKLLRRAEAGSDNGPDFIPDAIGLNTLYPKGPPLGERLDRVFQRQISGAGIEWRVVFFGEGGKSYC